LERNLFDAEVSMVPPGQVAAKTAAAFVRTAA
jgi:hypothetical protein